MIREFKIIAGLAISSSYLACAGAAQAQEWYNNTQAPQFETPAAPAQESKNWNYSVGGGTGLSPVYEGSDKFEVQPVPVVSAEYKDGLFSPMFVTGSAATSYAATLTR